MKNNFFFTLKTNVILLLIFGIVISCEDDNNPKSEQNSSDEYVLSIENGAQTIQPNQTIAYKAILIDGDGNTKDATSEGTVSWSTSSSNVATISSGGQISVASVGSVTITASITIGDKKLTASVPLGIVMPSAFTVAPSAIIYEKGGSIQLETVYLSTNGVKNPTCTFQSSDSEVATVSNTGLVEFIEVGECAITVTATNIDGTPSVIVPVLVIGKPEIALPIARIEVDPPSKDLFKNETQQLTAKAFDVEGNEVEDATFSWNSINTKIAVVDTKGLVTPVKSGKTYIQASSNGIIGQAEILVYPDTLVWIEPFNTSLAAGASKQFTATAYHVTRTTATPYDGISFDWMIPTYGMSLFDIATVNESGLVTIKEDAIVGMITFVGASVKNKPDILGVSTVMVAMADDCDCGNGNSQVDHLKILNTDPISMTLTSAETVQLNVEAYDVSNSLVSEPGLKYCSDNISVANIDSDGIITATGEGTATIKVCSGSYAESTITVKVSFF